MSSATCRRSTWVDWHAAWDQDSERTDMTRPGNHFEDDIMLGDAPAPRQHLAGYIVTGIAAIVGIVVATLRGGPMADFMLAGAQVVPFALLAFFAYLGMRHTWARILSFVWLGIVLMSLAGLALLLTFGLLLMQSGALDPASGATNQGRSFLPPGGAARLGMVALWGGIGLAVAAIVLLPAVRRDAARLLPIDARWSVHAIALSFVMGATTINFGQLLALGGKPPMLEMVPLIPAQSATQQLLAIVYPFLWNVPGAIVAVGYPVARTFRATLYRLGLVRPTVRQVAIGVVVALAMVLGATLLDMAISTIWDAMGWIRTDTAAFEKLLGAAMSPIGAVLIGVTAGLGEEMIIRGALQPRLGIILSNLFFTSLHAYQYSWDGLLSVFIIGTVLGIVRARTNTTTSSIAHGVYNFTLVMLSVLGQSQ